MPGEGTTLQESDKELGVFEGKGSADAVFSIWLGSKPAFEDLRKGDARADGSAAWRRRAPPVSAQRRCQREARCEDQVLSKGYTRMARMVTATRPAKRRIGLRPIAGPKARRCATPCPARSIADGSRPRTDVIRSRWCWHKTRAGCWTSCRFATAGCHSRPSPSIAAPPRSWPPTWPTPRAPASGCRPVATPTSRTSAPLPRPSAA